MASQFRPDQQRRQACRRRMLDGRGLYESHNSAAGGDHALVVVPALAIAEEQDSGQIGRGDPVAADTTSLEIGEEQGGGRQAGAVSLSCGHGHAPAPRAGAPPDDDS